MLAKIRSFVTVSSVPIDEPPSASVANPLTTIYYRDASIFYEYTPISIAEAEKLVDNLEIIAISVPHYLRDESNFNRSAAVSELWTEFADIIRVTRLNRMVRPQCFFDVLIRNHKMLVLCYTLFEDFNDSILFNMARKNFEGMFGKSFKYID